MKSQVRKMLIAFVIALSLAISASPVMAIDVVIGAPGDTGSGNCFPFGCSSGTRYQQVYSSGQFSSPMTIRQLDFFNTQYNPGLGVIDSATYAIHLSTTSVAVNSLDTVNFANNVGSNDAVFFTGNLGGPIGGMTFAIFGNGFYYDPSQGNLLVDIFKSNDQDNGNVYLDAHNGTFDSISSRAHNFGSSFAEWGLVTGFTDQGQQSVPEPATMLLLGLGLVGLAGMRKKFKS